MNEEWNNLSWIQSPLLIPIIWIVLIVGLIVATIWFIDGVLKYGYWLKKDKDK